jgi:transcriptional regulator with XRE-family HTH domain
LKSARGEHGWSQDDLSRRCGLHTTAISKVERGARSPRLETIATLARALACTRKGEIPAGRLLEGIPAPVER